MNNYRTGGGSRNEGINKVAGRTKTPTLGSRKQSTAGPNQYGGRGVWPRTQTS